MDVWKVILKKVGQPGEYMNSIGRLLGGAVQCSTSTWVEENVDTKCMELGMNWDKVHIYLQEVMRWKVHPMVVLW